MKNLRVQLDGALDRVGDETIFFGFLQIRGIRLKSFAEAITTLGSTKISVI